MPGLSPFSRGNFPVSLLFLPIFVTAGATLLLMHSYSRSEWTYTVQASSKAFLNAERNRAYETELASFYDFAASRNCTADHPMYDMIFTNLKPYETEGIPDDMIERALYKCRDTMMVEISENETGKVLDTTLKPGSTYEGLLRKDWFDDFFQQLLPFLPNTKLVINLMDEPCSWTAPLPPEDEAAYAAGDLSLEEAWLRHGCDSVGMARMKDVHGFFVSPATFPATREKVPAWSWYSIPGCFSDLLGPNHGVGSQGATCPPADTKPFREKVRSFQMHIER